jgi:6-phospho-3-hexuloisomerase
MNLADGLNAIFDEMHGVFARMPPDAPARLAVEIAKARRVFVFGVGRTGLALQGFSMRLMHLGIDGHFIGQLSVPPAGSGDLLFTALALGRLPTGDAIVKSAKTAGARITVITARPEVVSADIIIPLPAQTMADPMTSILPLGSPFELALSLFCDLTVVELMVLLGRSNADLVGRHANIL